jgi:hypothetical protein
MTDYELSETLKTATKSVGDNIALQMLLLMAAERIEQLSEVQTPGNYNERTY